MKDHEIAQLVNALRDCAIEFHDAQQLRERIATLVVPALRGERSQAAIDLQDVPHEWLAEVAVHQIQNLTGANKGIRRLRRKLDKAHEDMDDLRDACSLAWAAAAKAEASNPLFRSLSDDECAALTRVMGALDDPARHSAADYGRAWVNCVTAALQNRTADPLITNQDKNTPETSQNQDVTPKTAPAQPAQVAPTESSGCEGVTAGLERYIDDHIDWLDRLAQAADYERSREPFNDAARSLLTRFYLELRSACADTSRNARWLSLAHALCADAGVPSGHIADRLEGLRALLESRS